MKKIDGNNKRVLGVVTRVVSACFIFFTLLLPLNAAANVPGHLQTPYVEFTHPHHAHKSAHHNNGQFQSALASFVNHINLIINSVAAVERRMTAVEGRMSTAEVKSGEISTHTAVLESRIEVNGFDSERETVEDNGGCQDLSAAEERDELKERVSELEKEIENLKQMFYGSNA